MGIMDLIKKGFGIGSKNLILVLILFVFNLVWNMVNIAIIPPAALPLIATS